MSALAAAALAAAALAAAADGTPAQLRYFHADISADFQTSLTDSNAIGSGEFTLDTTTSRLSWSVKFDRLTSSPSKVELHAPAPIGTDGPVMVNLAPKGIKNPLEGSAVLTDGQIEYLLAGWVYISISTRKYPGGELRGWLMRCRTASENPNDHTARSRGCGAGSERCTFVRSTQKTARRSGPPQIGCLGRERE